MVDNVVGVVERVIKFALGLAVIGVGARLLGLGQLVDAAQEEHGAAVIRHSFERLQCDRMVDLGRSVAIIDLEPLARAILLHGAERRIGDHHVDRISTMAKRALGGVLLTDAEALRRQRGRACRVEFVRRGLLGVRLDQESAVAGRWFEHARLLVDESQPRRDVGQRDRRRIGLVLDAGRRANGKRWLAIVEPEKVVEDVDAAALAPAASLDDLARRAHHAKLYRLVDRLRCRRAGLDGAAQLLGGEVASLDDGVEAVGRRDEIIAECLTQRLDVRSIDRAERS